MRLYLALFLALVAVTGFAADVKLADGLTRFNPAGLSWEWQFEGAAFNALSRPDTSIKTVPVIRLQHALRGFFLTVSQVEAAAAEQAGFTRQGIAFYTPSKSVRPVYRYVSKENASYFYTPDRGKIPGEDWIYEGVAFYANVSRMVPSTDGKTTPAAQRSISISRYRHRDSDRYLFLGGSESPYRVGAFYYGAYTADSKAVINGTHQIYRRQGDWWGGVTDFYGQENGISADSRGWIGKWPHLKPSIGYYSQSMVSTLRKHIVQATDAGLSFFSFYWYWSKIKDAELLPESLQSFLLANIKGTLKFNLSLYSHPWDNDMIIDESNALTVADAIIGYFSHQNYLRLSDGRPVIVIGDYRNFRMFGNQRCNDAACYSKNAVQFLRILTQRSVARLGVAPFVQLQAGVAGWSTLPEVDGFTCLVPPIVIEGETPYPLLEKTVFDPLKNTGKPVSPCMLVNFDERPRQDILITDRKAIRFFVGKTDAAFRHNLEVTKQFSDEEFAANRSPAAHIVYLYAWNEWHEGGVLEPNMATGARDLNIVTDVFQLPRSPSSCLDKNLC